MLIQILASNESLIKRENDNVPLLSSSDITYKSHSQGQSNALIIYYYLELRQVGARGSVLTENQSAVNTTEVVHPTPNRQA